MIIKSSVSVLEVSNISNVEVCNILQFAILELTGSFSKLHGDFCKTVQARPGKGWAEGNTQPRQEPLQPFLCGARPFERPLILFTCVD